MFGVTESKTKRTRVRCGSREWLLVVTNATRRQLFSCCRFTARSVAGVTLVVGRKAGGNPERRPARATATVARRTSARRPGSARHVLGMIKFNVEAFFKFRGKTLQRRIRVVDICMADYAHRHAGSYKLSLMATEARFVSGKNWRR